MSRKWRKMLVLAIAVPFIVTSVAFAQSQSSPGASSPSTSGQRQPMGSPTGTMSDSIFATVADVDQKESTVKLRMQNGESVELQVPQQVLSELNKGDSVQVSIRKADKPSGMGGSSREPSQPGAGPSGTTRPRTQ
jgi:hypothetical protein